MHVFIDHLFYKFDSHGSQSKKKFSFLIIAVLDWRELATIKWEDFGLLSDFGHL